MGVWHLEHMNFLGKWGSAALVLASCSPAPREPATRPAPTPAPAPAITQSSRSNWYKGNLHTHSLWTDGADFPEMIAAWYKDHGYNFLGITEHDMLQEGVKWVDINAPDPGWPPRNASARAALPEYRARFGGWVEERTESSKQLVRLRGLSEYRHLFEQPGRFILIMGEEITDRNGAHLNAFNLARAVLPRGGVTTGERIRNNIAAVGEQARTSARPVLTIVNHPNFIWALTAEEIAAIPDARLFEVYNGHTMTNSAGNAQRAGTERIWDVVLALRHEAGGAPLFGVATDDAHEYRSFSDTISRPGRAWVMVRAAQLTSDSIVASLARGDFYASTGVTLRDVARTTGHLRVEILPEPGVTFRTQFIGTRRAASLVGTPIDTLRTTRRYGAGVGEVLAEVTGDVAEYRFNGDERYVRAKVISSRPYVDPATGKVNGSQTAWVQPAFRP